MGSIGLPWRLTGIRPENHPARRLAGAARLLVRYQGKGLLTGLLERVAEAAGERPQVLTTALRVDAGLIGPRRADEMAAIIGKVERHLRLAVLSGCGTAKAQHVEGLREVAAALIRHQVPAVLSVQFAMSKPGNQLLYEILYPALATGETLGRALSAARRRLLDNDDPAIQADAFAPVLYAAASIL